MKQIEASNKKELLLKTLKFHTLGLLDGTAIVVTGWLPNLPGYLKEHSIHPHDHFGVDRLLGTAQRGGIRFSAYEYNRGERFSRILLEAISADTAEYWEGQVRVENLDDWLDTTLRLQGSSDG